MIKDVNFNLTSSNDRIYQSTFHSTNIQPSEPEITMKREILSKKITQTPNSEADTTLPFRTDQNYRFKKRELPRLRRKRLVDVEFYEMYSSKCFRA